MKKRFAELKRVTAAFRKDESGATLVEYAVAVGVVILIGAASFQAIGTNAASNFSATGSTVAAAA